jgi:predicted transcriptional regulator
MKPVDFRNETFASLQNRIAGQRANVLKAWLAHGPGTTAEVAERAKFSILSFRPRTTELLEMGFIALAAKQTHKGEGIYFARTIAEHEAWAADRIATARNPQREFAL